MWETFLLQMNDFDRFLEMQLRHMLDPVVATPAPSRRLRRKRVSQPILTVEVPAGPATEAIPLAEPVVVAVPAAASQH